MIENLNEKIKAYALKNAIAYKGKANPGAVVSALFNEGLEKSEVKEVMPKIQEIIKGIESLDLEKQKEEFEKFKEFASEREVREGLPELPNSEKGVVMRFAPSASGPMHAAHAIVAGLSIDYVKKYGGKFYQRIEDTNPENVDPESYILLKEDGKWLSQGISETIIQSDRMDLYYGYAVALIEKGAAYVCECSGDKFRELAKEKKECPCRKKSIEKNIEDWEKMLDKNGFKEGEVVLRFKTPENEGGMQHRNPAMRDFPLARINEHEHPRQGKKYRVWPLMNLSVAVDDIDLGMTHIIRGKDHRDNAQRQKMIFEIFNEQIPWTGFLGRIHFQGLEFSTSKFREGIEKGIYSGWDDEKLPTLASLRKRGYKAQAFLKLAEHIGLSEVDKTINSKDFFELLDNFNRD
ncbi:MAG TPA: glutamate--tRNA ligase family protein [Candidatus Nanoarchaeia archaeon]|nr:glutamate--tRNA ligase family protein [Candidatus Nanoarchaeia archaeon]